jgi:ATP-dependent protease ClpP protease subunit
MTPPNDDKIIDNKAIDIKPLGNIITIYLSGEIGSAENYIGAFETIRHASDNDIVKFNINSPGGDLFTTIQFIRAITECKAMVIASAEGACMSAATMIFLSADRFEISEHCLFMFHNYSGGTFGKGGEMYDQLINERKWSEKIIQKCYEGFLTEAEIRSILENKDIWMEGEEVMKRLSRKIDGEIKKAKAKAKSKPVKLTKKASTKKASTKTTS